MERFDETVTKDLVGSRELKMAAELLTAYRSDRDETELLTGVTGTLERVERMRSSANGNPRFAVTIDAGGTYSETYQTGVDASVAYEVANYKMGRRVTLTLEGKRESIVDMTETKVDA